LKKQKEDNDLNDLNELLENLADNRTHYTSEAKGASSSVGLATYLGALTPGAFDANELNLGLERTTESVVN
jgi:hypothetical protein